jgi:hypothetical protein
LFFQTPTFAGTILKSHNLNLSISYSLSDAGICTTLNGNPLKLTFSNANDKIKDFKRILGASDAGRFDVKRITGSGNDHQKKMWLNVRDITSQIETEGTMIVSINGWRDFVSVR